jgi:glycosyltransferase involved in cell wall biosynthesis
MNKLNMMCPIGVTGYGITSFNIYKKLRDKYDVSLFPIGNPQIETEEEKAFIVKDIENQITYDKSSPTLKIWHQFDLATRVGNAKYGALTFFETDKLKPIEIHMLNNIDIVYVASGWGKQILENNGVTSEIVVSPLGIDPTIFNLDQAPPQKLNDRYIFCNIGKWELRKGHDILVEIFNKTFSPEDNVELWMLNFNPFLTQEENMSWVNLYKNTKLGEKIKIMPRIPKHADLAKLIALSDCGIFPARAEGWNNEIPEFFAMNKPVITTNYSAHTQYCNKDNSYLIEIDSLTKAIDDKFFDGYGNWANLGKRQQDQMSEYMRYVYNNNIRSNPAGLETAKVLTWDNTANIISQHL